MENQHRLIRGYRDLDRQTIDAINRLKELERSCLEALRSADLYVQAQSADASAAAEDAATQLSLADAMSQAPWQQALDSANDEVERIHAATPSRWAALARTHMELGFMCAVRALAQPVNVG